MANEKRPGGKSEQGAREKPVSLAPLDFEEVIDGLLKIAPPREKPQPQKRSAAEKSTPAARRKTR